MRVFSHFPVIVAIVAAVIASSCWLNAQQLASSPSLSDAPRPQPLSTGGHNMSDETDTATENSKNTSSNPDPAAISGTITDVNGDLVPGATVVLDGPQSGDHREVVSGDNAGFVFANLTPGISYRVSVRGKGFVDWTSSSMILAPGQFEFLTDIRVKVEGEATSVTVFASNEQLAAEQVRMEEQQRVLGLIPNFYVVYDSKNAVPLTAKLKFRLATRVLVDPVTIGGVAGMAAINQAANRLNYVQGAKGYGQRFGAIAADGASDILIGGAILPSLLHQDPRYFYQGEGTTNSRLRHAILSPFICRGDNGRLQPNYSSLGGDLASSALSNTYYPQSNRGIGLVFGTFAIGTAERMLSGIAQEFILPRFTPKASKKINNSR
jgi:hypothetical protein